MSLNITEMIDKTVLFTRVRDVKLPNRANKHDAGTDFFVPNYSLEFLEILIFKNNANNLHYEINEERTSMKITIPVGELIMIPSGVKVWIKDKHTYLQATNKSGVASKFHLDVMANTIDADYQGEIHINLLNNGNIPITIETGQKLVQFIHKIYIDTDWQELDPEQYKAIGVSDRGDGMAGSTGIF